MYQGRAGGIIDIVPSCSQKQAVEATSVLATSSWNDQAYGWEAAGGNDLKWWQGTNFDEA